MRKRDAGRQKLEKIIDLQNIDLEPDKPADFSVTQTIVRQSLSTLVASKGGPFELSAETIERLPDSIL